MKLKSLFRNLTTPPDEKLERVTAERDALQTALDEMCSEYEVLKRNVVKLIEAQRELHAAALLLKNENTLLKQAIVAKTTPRGIVQ